MGAGTAEGRAAIDGRPGTGGAAAGKRDDGRASPVLQRVAPEPSSGRCTSESGRSGTRRALDSRHGRRIGQRDHREPRRRGGAGRRGPRRGPAPGALLPAAPCARRAFRRALLRRREVDGHLLPARLPRPHAESAQLHLLAKRRGRAASARDVPADAPSRTRRRVTASSTPLPIPPSASPSPRRKSIGISTGIDRKRTRRHFTRSIRSGQQGRRRLPSIPAGS